MALASSLQLTDAKLKAGRMLTPFLSSDKARVGMDTFNIDAKSPKMLDFVCRASRCVEADFTDVR